jgi:hypothetical protein
MKASMRKVSWRLLAACVMVAPGAGAQVIRGTVNSEGTPVPIPGAVVTLLDGSGAFAGRRALTDRAGSYAMRAPGPGSWVIEVRAIGFSPYRSRARAVASGETIIANPTLRRVATRLASLRIEVSSPCRRATDLDPVASALWDDVWAALASAEVAREQRMVRAEVFVYTRDVDVLSGRVMSEQRGIASVLDERPFRTAPAADLIQNGFWRRSPLGNIDFYGISAGTLISDEFLGTHCFSLVRQDSGRTARVGLSFRPVRSRPSDVQGVLWVHPESRELRELEFRYTGLQLRGPAAGGSLSFSRLASGLLVDDQWTLQHPFETPRPPGEQRTGLAPAATHSDVRPGTTLRLAGGFVLGDTARVRRFSMVLGRVERGGEPADATTVEILGGWQRTSTDSSGAFMVRDMLPGAYEVRLMQPGSDEEGGFVQHGRLELAGGEVARVDLAVPDAGAIAAELCPGWREDVGTAPLYGVLRDAASGRPAANYQVELQWTPAEDSTGARIGRSGAARVLSDWRGEFLACDVPSLGQVRFRTTARDAEWSDPIPAGRRLRVIEVMVDSSATPRPPGAGQR